jgi:septum formation protein
MRVARRHAGALVIGADQMLVCEGTWFDKPESVDMAKAQLRALRGRKHELISAVCVVRDATRLWHHRAVASLWMRAFSDAFLERYVAETAEDCTSTVGAYRVEGPGIQLFQRIEGDHSTILGLPMLPLLDFLRNYGAVAT